MKAVACLVSLCFLGTVSADFAWETGKSYKYRVISRALAGLTEIGNKYNAGLQIVYDQICTPTSDDTVNVKFENLTVVVIDEALQQRWRLHQGTNHGTPIKEGRQVQIDQQFESYLTSPMDMKVVNGVVEGIKVDGELPTWAINIKRAQASVFSADTTGKKIVVPGNLNRQTGAGGFQEQESGYFIFKVLEETVHGKCEVRYTITQSRPFGFQNQAQQGQRRYQNRNRRSVNSYSPSSSSSEESQDVEEPARPHPFDLLCRQGDLLFEIFKIVNFTTCERKPLAPFESPSELNFHPGDNAGGSLWTRALVSRIHACGQSLRKFTLLKIFQDEKFLTSLRDQEKFVASTQNNVTLISIDSANPKTVLNPVTIQKLIYQFDPTEVRHQLDGGEGQQSYLMPLLRLRLVGQSRDGKPKNKVFVLPSTFSLLILSFLVSFLAFSLKFFL